MIGGWEGEEVIGGGDGGVRWKRAGVGGWCGGEGLGLVEEDEGVIRGWVGGRTWWLRRSDGWWGRGWVGERVVVIVVGLDGEGAWG